MLGKLFSYWGPAMEGRTKISGKQPWPLLFVSLLASSLPKLPFEFIRWAQELPIPDVVSRKWVCEKKLVFYTENILPLKIEPHPTNACWTKKHILPTKRRSTTTKGPKIIQQKNLGAEVQICTKGFISHFTVFIGTFKANTHTNHPNLRMSSRWMDACWSRRIAMKYRCSPLKK